MRKWKCGYLPSIVVTETSAWIAVVRAHEGGGAGWLPDYAHFLSCGICSAGMRL